MKVGPPRFLLLLLGLPFALSHGYGTEAHGQERHLGGAELAALTLEELVNVEIHTPAKVAQPVREAPSVGAVIPRSQIDDYGWLSLNDIIFRQPGFAPARDFERLSVSSRGLFESWNNNHLLMLFDGVPFNNTSNGWAYTWDVFPLLLVENVEILRGPGSALYGSNATNGVVAVNSRTPPNERPLEARLRLGNASTQHYEVLGGQTWSWVSLVLAYSHHRTLGDRHLSYDGSGRADPTGNLRLFPVDDRSNSHYVYAKVEGQGALRGLSLKLHAHRWDFQTGHGWLFVVPDERDRAIQTRGVLSLRYQSPPLLHDRLRLDLVVNGQRHEVDYRIKYLPSGAQFGGVTYPNGVVEIAKSAPRDLFVRTQAQLRLWKDMTFLFGVERSVFAWPRDKLHLSNVDINRGGTLAPFPDGRFEPIRPLFEGVLDRPVENLGLYVQYASGRVLRDLISATVGLRDDVQLFEYTDLAGDGSRRRRWFRQLSPRLGLVAFPHPAVTLKAMAERAFRAPAPSELFVTNSLLGNSRTDQLKPEQITTGTLAADVLLGKHLNLRLDWFYTHFQNQIAFSASKNFSANLYSRRVTGAEAELLFDAPLGSGTRLGGFANYTLSHLLGEEVLEPSITRRDRLTWAPRHVANAGATVASHGFTLSVQGHYQGRVYRRDSDRLDQAGFSTYFAGFRPPSVAPWFTLDARLSYRFLGDRIRVGVQASNLLDTRGYLIKTNDYPFDYQIDGIRVLGTLELALTRAP